ncbi:MAG: DUF4362 domain-containing protein [Clostridiales bacterium]|nr:DUF4362 domain-containing protein [Clostridiales bacterium]
MNKFLKVVITLLLIFVIAEGAIIGYDIYQKQMNNKKEDNSNSKIEKNEDKDKELDNKKKEKKNKDEEEYDKIISSRRKLENLPTDYNITEALKDKSVLVNSGKIYNYKELEKLITAFNNKKKYSIRVVNYTKEGKTLIADLYTNGNGKIEGYFDSSRDIRYSSYENNKIVKKVFDNIEKEEQEENTIIVLKGENIDELYLLRYSKKDIPVEYNSEYTLNITRKEDDSNIKRELITDKNFEQKHGYNVYYYGVEKVKVLQNGKEIDLKEAISKDNAIIEKIVLKAEKDTGLGIVKNYGMYKDGGTEEYEYDDYNIIKSNRLAGENSRNRDVYITRSDLKYYKIPDEELKN